MKIRTQLTWLILGIITVPIILMLYIFLYHYFTSPQRYLLKGFKEIRNLNNYNLSDKDWDKMKHHLQQIPPGVEVVVYMDKSIVISSFPELPVGTEIDPKELFNIVCNTSDIYDYQFQSPQIPKQTFINNMRSKHIELQKKSQFLVLSRSKVDYNKGDKSHGPNILIYSIFIFLSFFEFFCILLICFISHTITTSITVLEKSTQRIASGELDIDLHTNLINKKNNEISSLAKSFERMRLSLKDDEERRARFIMGLSHDLRTPVALIKGYTEAITDGIVNNQNTIKNSLSIIHSKADLLESMIDELINYVKLNNHEWRQKLLLEDIEQIISEFENNTLITGELYKRKVIISNNITKGTLIPLDKALFQRALENLISNAVRYTKENDTITICSEQTKSMIELTISDTGCGINEKDIDHIYELFYRGTSSRRENGMGIGLSVVKNIIDTHGWTISVESEINIGTSFTIKIPLKSNLSVEY